MNRRKIAAMLLLLGVVAGTIAAPEAGPEPAPFAHRLWAVMDVVREKHPEPPARADMIREVVKAVRDAAKVPAPDDLDRRVRGLETREQFTDYLKDVWPRGDKAPAAEVLEAAALKGLVLTVPGGVAYWPPQEARVAEQISGNRYVGIGIQLRIHEGDKLPQIVIPFRGGPAHRGGIKPDDLIIEVDGQGTKDVPLVKVVEMLRGEEGTTLTVLVRAPGSAETRTVKMTRTVVPFEHVMGYRRASEDAWDYLIDPKGAIGYVRVDSCSSSTPQELRQAERRLRSQGARALVLDFRGTRADSDLHNGTLLAAALLDDAPLWRQRGVGEQVREFRSGRDCLFRDWPLVVLVDGLMDSTTEAVAAALQDNGRAVLVGESTRGDGAVISRFSLADGQGAVVLRTGRLERVAKGRGWPVEPDHTVWLTETQYRAVAGWLAEKGRPPAPGSAADKAPTDPQVDKAVELLRAALTKADQGRGR